MTKASEYPFSSILVTEQASKPTAPAAGRQRIYIKTDHKFYHEDSGGTETEIASGTGSGPSLLGVTEYGNASDNVSITSATLVDVDATNLSVTFTAPASGNVLVRITAAGNTSGDINAFLGVREGTTNVGSAHFCFDTNGNSRDSLASCVWYITGLSAGSHIYKVAACINSGTLVLRKSALAPVTIEVWEAV